MPDTVDVRDIPARVTRNPGKPLVLLVRLASRDMGIWDTIWADFAREFTVANFDLGGRPAMAQLDTPREAFRGLARDCADVAAGLGFERFHVFGWNGGTQIALRCRVDHADRVASGILLDPFHELPDMRHVERAIEVKRALFAHPDRRVYTSYWVMAGLSDRFIETRFDEVEKLVAARLAGDRFVRTDVERFTRWVRAIRRTWVSDAELAGIAAPTLIAATEQDRWSAGPSVAMARALHAKIPGARLAVIEGVGGLFPIEDPARFRATVAPFLQAVLGSPTP